MLLENDPVRVDVKGKPFFFKVMVLVLGPPLAPIRAGDDFVFQDLWHKVSGFMILELLAVFLKFSEGEQKVSVSVVLFFDIVGEFSGVKGEEPLVSEAKGMWGDL